MTGRQSPHRVLAGTMALAAGVAVLGLAGCSALVDDAPPQADGRDEVRTALVASGDSAEVVDCVLRLGSAEIDRNNYDDVLEDELRAACLAAQAVMNDDTDSEEALSGSSTDAGVLARVDDSASYGDDGELDLLWDDCEAGSGSACDELFRNSPLDSGYEQFGLSCGERPDVARCADLDDPELDQNPADTELDGVDRR